MGGMADCKVEAKSDVMPAAVSDETKIRLRQVGKSFSVGGKSIRALRDVDLDVRAGEFCCIVGPSGCGKTTLLRILAGLERHSEGEVSIRQDDPRRPLNAMVFQEQSVFPWMTVRDNVGYGLRRRGVPAAEVRDAVGYYVQKVGLHAFAAAYPHQLSGGMKQRVSIARAFANDPEILLMDEPFAALDEQNKAILQEELLRIWEESRKTVLFITHSIDEALVLGDRALVMTARPGTIKHDVVNTIPRPRSVYAMKSHPDYGALNALIWDHLRGEVQRTAAKSTEPS